jgi:hypothetical protein
MTVSKLWQATPGIDGSSVQSFSPVRDFTSLRPDFKTVTAQAGISFYVADCATGKSGWNGTPAGAAASMSQPSEPIRSGPPDIRMDWYGTLQAWATIRYNDRFVTSNFPPGST